MRESSTTRHSSIPHRLSGGLSSDLNRRKARCAGFTIIELMVVITVMGILTLMGMRAYAHFIDKARNTRAIAEIRLLDKEITGFLNQNDRLPYSLAEIGRATMLDPWENAYQYINFEATTEPEESWRTTEKTKSKGKGKGKGLEKGEVVNSDYDLYSMGKDGMSVQALEDETSRDDIIRGADGSYIGLASEY